METLLEEIQEYLDTNEVGTSGSDLFISILPVSPDNAIGIFETGGIEPDKDITQWRKPTIQVLVRNVDYSTGKSKMEEIFNLLHGKGDDLELKSGGLDIVRIDAITEPQQIEPVDETGRYIFTCNFIFTIRNT